MIVFSTLDSRLDDILLGFRPASSGWKIWKMLPLAIGPFAEQAADRHAELIHRPHTFSIWLEMTNAGRCIIAEARIPVPRLVGQAVR